MRVSRLVVVAALALSSAQAAPREETLPLPGLVASGNLAAQLTKHRRNLGPKYVPRTPHLAPDGAPRFTNRLILETSPYLLQHAHNPVNWYPWGPEAFARAKEEGKPVFLSIGYSTCHWCHVMEQESFEDERIAALINANFIPIKVDREEHPEVDATYMTTVQALTGRGGWPMTLATTTAGEPFFAATYLPPVDSPSGGRGLPSVLSQLARAHQTNPERVVSAAKDLTAKLASATTPAAAEGLPDRESIDLAVKALASEYDPAHGGFGGAPKFPSPSSIELLLRQARRTGDAQTLAMATATLEAMAHGGIADQLGGGFHRYATDAAWRVPHFEKMLYDNAQLAMLYLDAWQLTGNEHFAVVARETLAFLERELRAPGGAFYAALDADSPVSPKGPQKEGAFYTWSVAELQAALRPQISAHVMRMYGVTPEGQLDGRNVLAQVVSLEQLAADLHVERATLEKERTEARAALFSARGKRPRPARDEKVVTAWNALAISAFARAASAFEDPALEKVATEAAEFMLAHLLKDGRLSRSWSAGRVVGQGALEDAVFFEQALLDLHETTQSTRWLELAITLQTATDEQFSQDKGAPYRRAPADVTLLPFTTTPLEDGAEPSGNSVAVLNLLRLAELTQEPLFRTHAEQLLKAQAAAARRGLGVHKLLSALDFALDAPMQLVVVEPGPDAGAGLLSVTRRVYLPNHVLVRAVEGEELGQRQRLLPLLRGRTARRGKATAYVCRHQTCELPTSDPTVLKAQLLRR